MRSLKKLQRTVETLRGPNGCIWDKKQTLKSLVPMLIEEVYELSDAVNKNSNLKINEELGDVLMLVFTMAQIGGEKNKFSLNSAAESINKKLIERHPHVFGNLSVKDEKEIIKNWNKIKGKKNKKNKEDKFDIPSAMPALLKARRIKEKAGLTESLKGLKLTKKEAGEYLFNVVSYLTQKKIDAETELNIYCGKLLKEIRKS